MNILAIISSHRKNHNTANVITLIKRQIEELSLKNNGKSVFEILYLSDYKINECIGCRACYHSGLNNCPLKDDMIHLKAKFKEATVVIFASPVYINSISGTMKVFIDRLVHLCHHLEAFDKYALLIVTTNKSGINHTLKTLFYATTAWGMRLIAQRGFPMSDSRIEEIDKHYHKKILELSQKIYKAILHNLILKPTLAQLVVFNIHKYFKGNIKFADKNPSEYEYFRKMGWSEPQTTYFIKTKVNIFKLLLAQGIANFIILCYGD